MYNEKTMHNLTDTHTHAHACKNTLPNHTHAKRTQRSHQAHTHTHQHGTTQASDNKSTKTEHKKKRAQKTGNAV